MTIERLRQILDFSKLHSKDIDNAIRDFCHQIELQSLDGVRDLFQIVKAHLAEKSFLFFQFPFQDPEIGAFVYEGDTLSYVILNSCLPLLNTNFAFCHELYHIFFPLADELCGVHIGEDYYANENELRANLFAGKVLMPELEFKQMFSRFQDTNQLTTLVALMNYFKVPFKAVYIRCYELGLLKGEPRYLELTTEDILAEFEKHWLDTSLLKPSYIDNSGLIYKYVQAKGCEYLNDGYINARMLDTVLENLKILFPKIVAGE